MAITRSRYKSVFLVELYLDSGFRVYATEDLFLIPSLVIGEQLLSGYNIGGYSGTTTSSLDQGYDVD
jgi:hypothetical protein